MEAYPSTAAVNNPSVPPAVPALVWTYEQRRRAFVDQNPSFTHGRGSKRRQRREVDTRQGLERRSEVLLERATWQGADGVKRTWRELVYAPLEGRAPYLLGLRARARTLMNQITAHGPASGWGVAQPLDGHERNSKWTPYTVPKRSEKCWRWWRAKRLELARLLKALGWLWGKPVPAHRTASTPSTAVGEPETSPVAPEQHPTRYRDRSAEPWAAAAARLGARVGM